jgi:hypothetical protein
MFNAGLVVYILYRRPLGGNIYKQWHLGGVIFVWLDIETWGFSEGGAKRGNR